MKNEYEPGSSISMGKILTIIGAVVALILAFFLVKWESVDANEEAVVQTWSGIEPETRTQGTYFFFPGFRYTVRAYDMGVQVYVMNDKTEKEEPVAQGRKSGSYLVQSRDQQDMRISCRVQWQRRSGKCLIALHRYAPNNVEEKLLLPALQNVVKNQATVRDALTAYSGEGLVKLQNDILAELQHHSELNQFLQITGYVIEHIGLDPKYTAEIVARQVAVQERLKNIEQTKAAESAAEKAKAVAQADYEKAVVEAKRDKETALLAQQAISEKSIIAASADAKNAIVMQEAESKKIVLAAEAEAKRNVAISEAQKQAELNRAVGIEAVGKSNAEANKLLLSSYSVPGSDLYTRIQVAASLAKSFENVKGYLPSNVSYNVVAENFDKGVGLLLPATK